MRVFWGTTNADAGGRRFWPVKIGKINVDLLCERRDQLWAEAVMLYKAGVPWWITKAETLRDAERHQRDRYIGDPWDDIIGAYAAPYFEVEIADILRNALHLDQTRWSQTEQNRVARCLRAQGYSRAQVRCGDKRVWRYRKAVTAGDTEDNNENVTPLKLVTTG